MLRTAPGFADPAPCSMTVLPCFLAVLFLSCFLAVLSAPSDSVARFCLSLGKTKTNPEYTNGVSAPWSYTGHVHHLNLQLLYVRFTRRGRCPHSSAFSTPLSGASSRTSASLRSIVSSRASTASLRSLSLRTHALSSSSSRNSASLSNCSFSRTSASLRLCASLLAFSTSSSSLSILSLSSASSILACASRCIAASS
eukprot:CAMPEP_0114138132 /NCGR_PEP_ID=MMETSP0043_2-20121206/16150_1 /TAXON_ID=464988 /ORGANISM="Hemiselmis andersenii, Strain CCMP644" /LENGTH=196 /DNA_ID=CAMNT_0001232063 /DNA_START=60 /DNA_END=647 /DNA_ORIENTATION=-